MKKNILVLLGFLLILSCGGCYGNAFGVNSTPSLTPSIIPTKTNTPTLTATEVESFPSEGIVEFKILHLNDFHGELLERQGEDVWIPGAARLSAFVKSEREKLGSDQTLILDAGDWLQEAPAAGPSRGEAVLRFYEKIGVQAATVGNHEFWYGFGRFMEIMEMSSSLKILSANFQQATKDERCTTKHLSDAYAIFVLGDEGGPKVRVAVIGAGAVDLQNYSYLSSLAKHVCFPNPELKIAAVYDEVKYKEKADVIIALTHNGFDEDQVLAQQLIDLGTPMDIIIGGHSHTWIEAPAKVGKTIIVTAGDRGRAVGIMDLLFDRSTGSLSVKWGEEVFTPDSPVDPEIAAFLEPFIPTATADLTIAGTPMPVGSQFLTNFEPTSVSVALDGFGEGVYPYSDADFIKGRMLETHGIKFSKGLFTNAPSSVVYDLGGMYKKLVSEIVVEDSTVCSSGAEFKVFLDDVIIYTSKKILSSDEPQHIELDVSNGKSLRLETYTAPDGTCDWTIWGNPYLVVDESKPTITPSPQVTATPRPQGDFLVNLEPSAQMVGYWSLGKGVFPGMDTGFVAGQTLESHKIIYKNGLFAHAPSELTYDLNGQYSIFTADISIKETACGDGAIFVVRLDEKEIYRSPIIKPMDAPLHLLLDITGGKELMLITSPGGDNSCDWTIWGDPYLVK